MAFTIKYPEGYEDMQAEKALQKLQSSSPQLKEGLKELKETPVQVKASKQPEGDN